MKPSSDKNMSVLPHGHIDRSNWKRIKLGDLGYTYNGLSGKTKQDFDTGEAFYIPFLNVLENTEIDINNLGRVKVSSLEKQVCVQKSDLFFNTSSETPEEVGMCAYLSQELNNTFLNSFCFGFRLYDKCAVDPRFLTYLFNSVYGRRVISSLAQGVTRYNLSKERLLRSEIHLPPITEQHRIANCINIVEENIVETNTLISKYEAIKKATVKLLLEPKEGWQRLQIKDFAQVYDGTHQTPHYTKSGIPFFSVENVTTNVFPGDKRISLREHRKLTAKFKIRRGDVLMTRIGSIGECRLVDWDYDSSFYVSLAALRFKPNLVLPEYFVTYSTSRNFQEEVNIHSLPFAVPQKINLGPISDIYVSAPPLNEQRKIATHISAIDNVLKDCHAQLAKAQSLKQGMMSYFFG